MSPSSAPKGCCYADQPLSYENNQRCHPTWKPATVVGVLVLLICCGLGLFARFHGLGERQLAVDEYYYLESVGRIVQQGVPAFPGGGYYTHGLLGQYVTAASVAVFGDTGFAQRLPAALFGLGSAALLFALALSQLGRRFAALLAGLLLVSSWEVEFSRFARMYAPFQCATLAFLLAYDRTLLGDRWDRRYLAHAAAIVMVLSHDLGILLLPLLFVPLLVGSRALRFPTRAHTLRYALVSSGVALACFAYTRASLRYLGVVDRYPVDFVRDPSPLLRIPEFPFWSAGPESTTSLMVLIVALAGAALIPAAINLSRGRSDSTNLAAEGLAGLLLVSAALHALLVSVGCALLLLFRYEVHRSTRSRGRYLGALALSALMATAWIAYALLTRDWLLELGVPASSLMNGLRRTFFGWPDLYSTLVVPWAASLPGIGALAALAIAHQLWTKRKAPPAELARNPALLVVMVTVALGMLETYFSGGTRYVYFIYPVALYTVALSISQLTLAAVPAWGERAHVIAASICVALFALSSDFNLRHLMGVTQPEASFRIGRFEGREAIWYPRYDYASPAGFLEDHAEAVPIIVVGLPPVSHYLDLDHAVFYPRERPIFRMVSRERGTRELWSQRQMLSSAEELRSYTAGTDTIWLVRLTETARHPFREADVWGDRYIDAQRRFVGSDGRVEVVSVALRPARSPR